MFERAWLRIDKRGPDECWPWLGAKGSYGYGVIKNNGGPKQYRAHRVAWASVHGEILSHELLLHSCDNRACCNVAHLRKGNQTDNMRDMFLRGRNFTKLSPEDVVLISLLSRDGLSSSDLAAEFGVSRQTIWKIKTGRIWGHIEAN